MTDSQLTHLNQAGHAHMVDVSGKSVTARQAKARAFVRCSEPIMRALRDDSVPKGDALAVARVAGIASVKRTPELLPLAHPVRVDYCAVDLELAEDGVRIDVTVKSNDRTGIEMEALTAASVAALNLIDMVKGVDKLVSIESCYVVEKSGGRSGLWRRPEDA